MADIEQISIYKFKNTVKTFEDCVKQDRKGHPREPFLNYSSINNNEITGKWWYSEGDSKEKNATTIPWVSFMNEVLEDPISIEYVNRYPRGLLLYKIAIGDKDTFYAITFGLGGDKNINKNKIIPDFGIKVAMNICNPDEIKSIQTSQHEAISIQSEKQILSGAGLSVFNIDYNDEFFKRIIGKTKKQYSYISSVTGGEKIQLKFNKDKPLTWNSIKEITTELNNLYNSESYKTTEFKSFDNWSFEKDEEKVNELNQKLVNEINNSHFDKISLCVPEFIDINRICFKYEKDEDNNHEELNFVEYISTLKTKKVSISGLQNRSIFIYDKETENTYSKWKVFQCIVAEILDQDNTCYILYNGLWRKISSDFRQTVSNYLNNNNIKFDENILVDDLKNDINICDVSSGQYREEVFNKECVRNNDNLFLFDKSKIDIANEKRYEICDILTTSKELIHVKKYKTGAASLSHIFTQAKLYSEAIIINTETRKTMVDFIEKESSNTESINNGKNKDSFKTLLPLSGRLHENEYTVVLCILTKENIQLTDLPFMTQYEISKMDDYLRRNRGFNVKYINRKVIMN